MTEANKPHITKCLLMPLLFLAIILSGCNDRPKEVLSEKKMVRLMADMELAEAYSNMSSQGHQDHDYRYELGRSVLATHGVTQEQLDTTLAWYGRNLDDYSELFEKVDKEILKRKKKLMNLSDEEMEMAESDILWKFGKNGLLSSLGNTDSWIFSADEPELQKGDRLQWSMHIDEPVQINGVLGVEYEDGSSEASSNVFIGRNRLELSLQTDTGKVVRRVYGTIRLKDDTHKPLFADSISVVRLPYDSMEYRMSRNVKHYGIPVVRKPKIEVKGDSIDSDEEEIEIGQSPNPDNSTNGKDKPIMWNGNKTVRTGEQPENQERLKSTPPRPQKPRKYAPAQPQRPKAPHERGGVMNPVKKKTVKRSK